MMTSAFHFNTIEEYIETIQENREAFVYTRESNPTTKILEEKLAQLEGGEKCTVFSSGMGAISATLFSLLKKGDHVLLINTIYSTTQVLLKQLESYGISWDCVNTVEASVAVQHIKETTSLIYFESPSTQKFELLDIKQIADAAKSRNIRTIIDNTWCTPLFQTPLKHGIDLVIHSCSKYISGHSDCVCGAVIGSKKLVSRITQKGLILLGAVNSPMNSFLTLRGLRTLPVRMKSCHQVIQNVLDYLLEDTRIEQIFHPYCSTPQQKQLAEKYLNGFGSLFSIVFKEKDPEKVFRFVNSLESFVIGVGWGGYESMVLPSFKGNNQEELNQRGLDITHTRLYIGPTEAELVIEDIQQALDKAFV